MSHVRTCRPLTGPSSDAADIDRTPTEQALDAAGGTARGGASQPAVFVNISAQGDSDTIGCRIKIDDAVKDERSANTLNAFTYCLDKSG